MIEAIDNTVVGRRGNVGLRPERVSGAAITRAARPAPLLRAGAEQHHRQRHAAREALRGPAVLLHSMIEQMGGAATSAARGDYVNLSV